MKKLLFFIALFWGQKANAQNYYIYFAGTGESDEVNSIKVENLTKGSSLTLNGSNILHLVAITTGITSGDVSQSPGLKIYPNPMTSSSVIQFLPDNTGDAYISVFDITGKKIFQVRQYLENSLQELRISGLNTGLHFIQIEGNSYQYSGKLLSNSKVSGTISIQKIISNKLSDNKIVKSDSKGIQTVVDMDYTTGDRLKFTGILGIYSTVKTDVPNSDKTITFNFIPCTDGDNNNYSVVEIGSQIWMAENLKTTKFNDGTAISLVTDNQEWSAFETTPKYCWYNNDPATYKDTYGALYNWSVLRISSNGGKNACPVGWHVPNNSEWSALMQSATGGMLKETDFAHWLNPNTDATNETGFTALPGGARGPSGPYTGKGISGQWWSSSLDKLFDYRRQVFEMSSSNGSLTHYSTRDPFGFSVRCVHGEMLLPSITTSAVTSVTNTSATSGGNILSNGYYDINDKGVSWSTSPNPIAKLPDEPGMDGRYKITYIKNMSDLAANTTHYVRAYYYCDQHSGPVYGNELVYKTYTGTVTDIDGNKYNTVTIGSQLWMAENLKTTKYNDGTSIPQVTDNAVWAGLSTPGYCWYNNDEDANKSAYGALYNWYVLNNAGNGGKNVCPIGWHVPADEEWTTMTDWFINNDYGYQGSSDDIAKSMAATSGWTLGSTSGTPGNDTAYNNISGFSALPGGYRNIDGTFGNIVDNGYWWSSSDSWYRNMNFGYSKVYRGQWGLKHGFSVRCIHGPEYASIITNEKVTSITLTAATSGGNVTSDDGQPVTARGVCWSTSSNPTLADSHTSDGIGLGSFNSNLTGLAQHTLYFVRAYATNSMGTRYGNEVSFYTQIADVEGNTYDIVQIGLQVWMAENLRTTKYNDGSDIPLVTDTWANMATPAYCWYNNDAATYKDTYGALYNWHTVNTGKLCPFGWHVPSSIEWLSLRDNFGGWVIARGKHKATGTIEGGNGLWYYPNLGATNESGFTALPAGYRHYSLGTFSNIGLSATWWANDIVAETPTLAYYAGVNSNSQSFGWSGRDKPQGYSVRCLKDN